MNHWKNYQTMDFPLFRSQRPKPSVSSFYGPTARGIPVSPPEAKKTTTTTTPKKVVQIPVRFFGSESDPDHRSRSALKIQKVFRGFLVRKSVKKIMSIKKEVDEIEGRVCRSEEVELIRKEAKERLKVNEMLMALLFKLDSVRGVDSGVRDCRRAVIKKAISLQERVDAIASSSGNHHPIKIENEFLAAVSAAGNSVQIPQNSDDVDFENGSGHGPEDRNKDRNNNELLIEEKCLEDAEDLNCEEEDVGGDSEMITEEENCVEDAAKEEVGVDLGMKVDEEACVEKEMLVNVEKENSSEVQVDSLMEDNWEEMCEKTPALSDCAVETVETGQMEDGIGGEEENDVRLGSGGEGRKDRGDDNKRNGQLLERMMEENEKMMKLMTQLYERNELQTQMLNTLTHRVEQLEKVFVCDKIKRKKKRHCA